ncbi:MAG: PhoH family protein [Acholeplasmatales bacterium]|jgi:phosphate starvation-inducible PhoH-like protein|nr:PhoH family protein [Acholeplasmatales bacterium]
MILKDYLNDLKLQINIGGANDRHLQIIKSIFQVEINLIDKDIVLDGKQEACNLVLKLLDLIVYLTNNNCELLERDLVYLCKYLQANNDLEQIKALYINPLKIINTPSNKPIYAKTLNQRNYCEAMKNNDIVFAIGPSGTGKTFLAVCLAVSLLKANKVKRIVLTRPNIEAGEQLGFLPGDLKEKIDPYLTPLYDSLYALLDKETVDGLLEKGIIEIAPLGYMRGRTIANTVIILDEAQNTTYTQLKMFITRLGFNSKMIITGDPSQVDLIARGKTNPSALATIEQLFSHLEGVEISKFEALDVVRHPLVQKIITRYEEYENSNS